MITMLMTGLVLILPIIFPAVSIGAVPASPAGVVSAAEMTPSPALENAPQTQAQRTSISQEFRRMNARIAALKNENDSLRARVTLLERNLQEILQLLPDLRNSLRTTVQAKAAMDSAELALVNRLSLIMNKIRLLEGKAAYIDSTNFEILSQLVLLENKIVSLTNSFNEVIAVRQPQATPNQTRMTDEEFRQRYIRALTAYQNGQYTEAIDGFTDLIQSGSQHELVDNSQYWLAECYYAMRNFKRAITEFGKVFTYLDSDKLDDAQYKIALSYWNAGNQDRARMEFQKLLDDFPNSEFGEQASRYLR